MSKKKKRRKHVSEKVVPHAVCNEEQVVPDRLDVFEQDLRVRREAWASVSEKTRLSFETATDVLTKNR